LKDVDFLNCKNYDTFDIEIRKGNMYKLLSNNCLNNHIQLNKHNISINDVDDNKDCTYVVLYDEFDLESILEELCTNKSIVVNKNKIFELLKKFIFKLKKENVDTIIILNCGLTNLYDGYKALFIDNNINIYKVRNYIN
jgi:hypothetical protein